jgi:hypothetical protein
MLGPEKKVVLGLPRLLGSAGMVLSADLKYESDKFAARLGVTPSLQHNQTSLSPASRVRNGDRAITDFWDPEKANPGQIDVTRQLAEERRRAINEYKHAGEPTRFEEPGLEVGAGPRDRSVCRARKQQDVLCLSGSLAGDIWSRRRGPSSRA